MEEFLQLEKWFTRNVLICCFVYTANIAVFFPEEKDEERVLLTNGFHKIFHYKVGNTV